MAALKVIVRRRRPTPTAVFDSYWRFAAERHRIYEGRANGQPPPWTGDAVLSRHRFTNAFRASDRVSQYLIGEVIYTGDQDVAEVFFRTVLFRLFNKVATWVRLDVAHGPLRVETFSVDAFDRTLTHAAAGGDRLYSAAYITPPVAAFGSGRKHRDHLRLVGHMLDARLAERVASAATMREAFGLLRECPGIGDFLAYQLITDLNYSNGLAFSEMEFVQAGPGARSGIRKCFADLGDFGDADVIRWVADTQAEQFDRRGIEPIGLWGRPLQLIDCQNLFCEVDKYARVVHPDAVGRGSRSRIKQRFAPTGPMSRPWFPPKWGINSAVEQSLAGSRHELDVACLQVDLDAPAPLAADAAPHLVASEDRFLPLG